MRVSSIVSALAAIGLIPLACSGGSDGGGSNASNVTAEPCADVDLPACPDACPANFMESCGEACADEGAECGNDIGDGMKCEGGTWSCSVHAPLGPGCNKVCENAPEDPCAGLDMPACPPECDD